MQTIVQLILIVGSILGGIAWLIAFLQKKFQSVNARMDALDKKLQDKVSQSTCAQRRQHISCNIGCNTQTNQGIVKALRQITDLLEDLKKK